MIIDTSVIVSWTERRSPAAIAAIRPHEREAIRSFVVHGELQSGVETASSTHRSDAIVTMRRATLGAYERLTSVRPLALDRLSAAFSRVTGTAKNETIKIGQNDRWILAEASVHGVGVLTADSAMFELAQAAAIEATLVGG